MLVHDGHVFSVSGGTLNKPTAEVNYYLLFSHKDKIK